MILPAMEQLKGKPEEKLGIVERGVALVLRMGVYTSMVVIVGSWATIVFLQGPSGFSGTALTGLPWPALPPSRIQPNGPVGEKPW
ncbi:MAG: hypothetical protein QJR00_06110 [Bacillota bacterium]|nr:hypothetical protein [Bacillota bacterium]